MIELSVPATFDLSMIEEYAALNRQYAGRNIRIAEAYGALPGRDSVRSPDSLPQVEAENLFEYAALLNREGISFRYTMNSLQVSAAKMGSSQRGFLENLLRGGINRISVAATDAVKLLGAVSMPGCFDVAVSTIVQLDSIRRIEQMLEFGASQLVLDIRANRNFHLLSGLRRMGERLDGRIILLANEFCGDCALRYHHYLMQSSDGEPCVPAGMEGYPFTDCIRWFMGSPASLLKGYWILPEWLESYRSYSGVRCFKIAGRTVADRRWHSKVVGAYMAGLFKGNLLELEPSDDGEYPFSMSCEAIAASGYLDHFKVSKPNCASQCGISCTFCDRFGEKLFSQSPFPSPPKM